jgi:hypothetical protein
MKTVPLLICIFWAWVASVAVLNHSDSITTLAVLNFLVYLVDGVVDRLAGGMRP